MKKIVLGLVLALLLSGNGYAEKRKSQLNLFFELPENYILSSELTLENIDQYATTKKEKNEWVELMNKLQPYAGTEMIFTKKNFINGGDHISLHSSKKDANWTGEKIKGDIDNYCTERLKILKNANKNSKNKRNNEKEVIKNHKCLLIKIPKFVDFSVFESHLNLANSNVVVYMNQFALPKSDRLMTIFLSCEKHCDEMLPIYEGLIASTYFGKCEKGNCENGKGTMAYINGSKYIGEFKGGIENGPGTWLTNDGSKFVGQFLKGYMSGNGKFIHKDRSEYTGEFKKGSRNGQGTFKYSNGNKYIGEFKNNKQHGQGTMIVLNVGKYIGEFKNGLYDGQGTSMYQDGSIYTGVYKDNSYYKGTLKLPDGTKYAGEFKNDLPNGQGIMTLPDGTKHVGKFKDGQHIN
jgi:hypothetical protein